MSLRKVQFWFELSSPYSAVSAIELLHLSETGYLNSHRIEIQPKIFMLGGLLKSLNLSPVPFASNKTKFNYMFQDVERLTTALKIKYKLNQDNVLTAPPQFPLTTITAARLILAVEKELTEDKVKDKSEKLLRLVVAIYKAGFHYHKDISDVSLLSELLNKTLPGINQKVVFENIKSSSIKAELKAQTEDANAAGIFGAPSFIDLNSPSTVYWGSDRLGHLFGWNFHDLSKL